MIQKFHFHLKHYKYDLTRATIDCLEKNIFTTQTIIYYIGEREPEVLNKPFFNNIIPDTIGEVLFNYVCEHLK